MTPRAPLSGLTPFGAQPHLLRVLTAMGIADARALAAAAPTPAALAAFVAWAGVDTRVVDGLWQSLAPFREALPKAKGRFPLGWVPQPAGDKSPPHAPVGGLWQLAVPPAASLLAQAQRSGVRDQTPRGTCVAFATCKALEIFHNDGVSLSPQYLYYHMKQPHRDADTHEDGSWALVSLDALEDHGVCTEALHPYSTRDYAGAGEPVCGPAPSAAAARDAAGRRTGVGLLLQRHRMGPQALPVASGGLLDWLVWLLEPSPPADVQAHLALLRFTCAALSGALGPSPRPVVGCFTWFLSSQDMASETGVMPLPLPGDPPAGGHAMTIVGYADDADYPGGGYLLVQNSWGRSWPRESLDGAGIVRICYAYAAAHMVEAGVPMAPGDHDLLRVQVSARGARGGGPAAPAAGPLSPGAEASAGAVCAACKAPLRAGARFCSQCGGAAGPAWPGVSEPPSPAPDAVPPPGGPLAAARARLDAHASRTQGILDAAQQRLQAVQGRSLPVGDAPHGQTRCVYCGSTAYGPCSQSPGRRHKHLADSRRCAWCGSTAYGPCIYAPHGRHEHGPGPVCCYCGSTAFGHCTYSPSGRHERG